MSPESFHRPHTDLAAQEAVSTALPPGVLATFLEQVAIAAGCPRALLNALAAHAASTNLPIADAVVSFGRLPEQASYETLASVSGMRLVARCDVSPAPLAVRMVPARVARRHRLVPLAVNDRTLTYAICRPFDDEAARDVAFTSGRRPQAVLVTRTDLDLLLDGSYPSFSDLEILVARLRPTSVVEPIEGLGAEPESAVIDLCNALVARAVEAGSSDIHVETTSAAAVVRFRISGKVERVAELSHGSAAAVCGRFRTMAGVDVSVPGQRRDGAFALLVDGRRIDVQLMSAPESAGEKLVLRVSDGGALPRSIDELGYPPDIIARLRETLAGVDGLVVVAGPTGSGTTTALYAALDLLGTSAINIVTVEDPVERRVPGLTQVPVNRLAGSSYASVVRSVLRQQPNVLMVAECRDAEVAALLGEAARSGHLVLSALHTADAVTAVGRLVDLGLDPVALSESLRLVLAQRLVRKLCTQCRVVHSDFDAVRLGGLSQVTRIGASPGPGCPACLFTAHAGTLVLAELLAPDAAIRQVILMGARTRDLRAIMQRGGELTMRDRGLQHVADGLISIQEVDRVLGGDERLPPRARDNVRVLVAEDDGITRMLVRLLLERDGYTVLEAANGRQAVEIAVREHPALVVMDLNMPEMNGYEAIAHLRRVPALAAMPVVVLTTEDGPDVERTVLRLGADDFVLKPFDPGVLSSRVNAAFRRLRVAA
jgi:type II secretory ATPase GspE/PulE/Tfp pilus assembly ATPase PilB-like protein/CheY-like chemotaxis protein